MLQQGYIRGVRLDDTDIHYLGNMEMDGTFQNKAQFLDVVEAVIHLLRDFYVAFKEEQYRVHWSEYEDIFRIRRQVRHERDRYALGDVGRETLALLQTLNLLNKFSHSCTRRVLGYSMTFRRRELPTFLEDSEYDTEEEEEEEDGNSVLTEFELRTDESGSLGDFTRMLIFHESILDVPAFDRSRFAQALAATTGSLRVICLESNSDSDIFTIESNFKTMMHCAPHLEEICFDNYPPDLLSRYVRASPGPFYMADFASLRVIRLNRCCDLHNLDAMEHGLPPELSPLHRITSLTTIHLQQPYFESRMQDEIIASSVWKVSWTRGLGESDFALDSVWIRVETYYVRDTVTVPAHVSELLKRARHLIFDAEYDFASRAASILLPIWSSLHCLTIITTDFPSGFLRWIPSSIGSLNILFRAHSCRPPPSFLDKRMFDLLKSRDMRNVHIHVCVSTLRAGDLAKKLEVPFAVRDEELFIQTRALCIERGGQFILENPLRISQ
ncbi:hypothetical protein SCHPADRAFT_679496 [Schizopora paradoxa]|uniref:Uncharacterized protein n=1 Tax=Schizopora paradoxa TaxID=27342 RepID=A0A0H2RPK6_9AGAM|nr:hypothetical protein SCHPADRAFT_679496 [Schizopora paradoxa]